jgi:hypothetical protein
LTCLSGSGLEHASRPRRASSSGMSSERELQRGVNFSGLRQTEETRSEKKKKTFARWSVPLSYLSRQKDRQTNSIWQISPLSPCGACVRVFVYLRKYLVGRQWVGRPICVCAALAPLRRVKIISLPTAPPSVRPRASAVLRDRGHTQAS